MDEKGNPGNRFLTPVAQPVQTNAIIQTAFSTIRQGTATNELTKIVSKPHNAIIDEITDIATIKRNGMTVNLRTGAGQALKASTHRLFDMLTVKLTESGAKSPSIELTIEEFMSRSNLKDRKEAYKQIRADLVTLSDTKITWDQKEAGEIKPYRFVNIADSGDLGSNGIINFTFGSSFFKVLLSYTVMSLHPLYWRINAKYNPNSLYYLRKIHELKNMNVGKPTEDRIAVQTLLDASPETKSYEEIKAGNRNYTDRIIEPFERDMDALDEAFTWEYCRSKGAPLTDEELTNMSYEIFKELLVKITWRAYPDQTKRLEKKASGDKARTRKKRAASKKKAE